MKLNDEQYAYAEATDFPVKKLVALAELVVNQKRKEGFNVDVHFKHTCHACRSRMMFEQPNMVYEEVECGSCGHKEPFVKGGFTLVYKFNDPEVTKDPVGLSESGKSEDTKTLTGVRAIKKGAQIAGIIDHSTGEEA
jgi:hypothetical protein